MIKYPKKSPHGSGEYRTFAEIGGVYYDDILVHYYVSPAEPDVGWGGGLEIESISFEDAGDISGDMTTEEEEELSIRISEYLNSYYEDRD